MKAAAVQMTSGIEVGPNLVQARAVARTGGRRRARSSPCCRRTSRSWRGANGNGRRRPRKMATARSSACWRTARRRAGADRGWRHHSAACSGRNARGAGQRGVWAGRRAHRPLRQDPPVRCECARTPPSPTASPRVLVAGRKVSVLDTPVGPAGRRRVLRPAVPRAVPAHGRRWRIASSCRLPSRCPPARPTGTCSRARGPWRTSATLWFRRRWVSMKMAGAPMGTAP